MCIWSGANETLFHIFFDCVLETPLIVSSTYHASVSFLLAGIDFRIAGDNFFGRSGFCVMMEREGGRRWYL